MEHNGGNAFLRGAMPLLEKTTTNCTTARTYGLSYGEGHMGLGMGHKTMVGFIVVSEFHIHSCICALFVVDLRCSAKKMKVLTS